jgi:hypothetical protein
MALLILEGRASAAALIDSGTSHNIICTELAATLEVGGSVLVPVHRVIRGGGQIIGHSTHCIVSDTLLDLTVGRHQTAQISLDIWL